MIIALFYLFTYPYYKKRLLDSNIEQTNKQQINLFQLIISQKRYRLYHLNDTDVLIVLKSYAVTSVAAEVVLPYLPGSPSPYRAKALHSLNDNVL